MRTRWYSATHGADSLSAQNLFFCPDCYGLVESIDAQYCSVCGHKKKEPRPGFVIRKVLLVPALLVSVVAGVNATECPELYFARQEPVLVAPLAGKLFELCNDEYAVLVSEVSRSAIYAVEKLTPAQMKGADRIKRSYTEFFEDYRLPEPVRVSPSSYSYSGFDRGHLAPAGDFSDKGTQQQSFSMANVVPQSPTINRGIWADVERTVRVMAKKGSVSVVTGPLYLGSTSYLKSGNAVPIPSNVFKAVYAPSSNAVGVYVAGNGTDERIVRLSLEEFTNLAGIDLFPSLPAEIKKIKGALPLPMVGGRGNENN